MTPKTAIRIREYLRHRGWVKGGVVVDAVMLPGEKRDFALQSLSLQARTGCLKTRGEKGKREYHYVREPEPRCSSAIAKRMELAKVRRAAREAERERKRLERERRGAGRAERKRLADRLRQAKKRQEARSSIAAIASRVEAQAAKQPMRKPETPRQTVDDYLARGGHIEVLPRGLMTGRAYP